METFMWIPLKWSWSSFFCAGCIPCSERTVRTVKIPLNSNSDTGFYFSFSRSIWSSHRQWWLSVNRYIHSSVGQGSRAVISSNLKTRRHLPSHRIQYLIWHSRNWDLGRWRDFEGLHTCNWKDVNSDRHLRGYTRASDVPSFPLNLNMNLPHRQRSHILLGWMSRHL